MNTRQMSVVELGLILKGLRSIYVAAHVMTHLKLTEQIETELAARGMRLADEGEVFDPASRVSLKLEETVDD